MIYFQNVHSGFTLENIAKGRLARAERCKGENSRLRSLAAGYLIAEKLKLDEDTFQYTPQGKPYLPGSSVHFSISHSGDWAVLAVADSPIGIDIERTDRENINKNRIAARFFTETERRWLADNANNPDAFYYVWTAREAMVKQRPNIKYQISNISEQLTIGSDRLTFSVPFKGYVMCVCV
ncbi:MAG: 4'-phosphopantetheinyl transferase superfamily protein [Oscillospiraceae bacterium]|nr:4'-phosphopantetheinyl transferase superfamily protein [Oscillospiraceae bacterium]